MTKPPDAPKKPYRAPRLTRFGDLRTLTRGNKKNKAEASGVKTKLGGGG
jgi:hypothetical protein